MEATFIERHFKNWVQRQFTAKASNGRQFERVAWLYCWRTGRKIYQKNVFWRGGEIDLITWDGRRWTLLEVRGRSRPERLPRETLTRAKRRRLLTFGRIWAASRREPVEVRLLEIVGNPWKIWLQLGTPWYRRGPFGWFEEFSIEEES